MAFAQCTQRESLRDIEGALRSLPPERLYHLGIRSRVSRVTLADANEARDWRTYADFAQVLIGMARRLYGKDALVVDLQQTVYALDSTTIDLCLSLFSWAPFQRSKAAVKLHTLLDLRGNIPSVIRITHWRTSDISMLDHLQVEAGSFYVMDRGYVDFARLYRLHQAGAFFVTRAWKNLQARRRYSHRVDPSLGLRSDHTIVLTGRYTKDLYLSPLRRVRYVDPERGLRLVFLTNNFVIPALTVAHLYKSRWQVELFFESSTWCTPLDVMEFRGSIALNRPLVGSLDGSVRPRIARRPLCAESRARSHKPASPATVSTESTAKQWSV